MPKRDRSEKQDRMFCFVESYQEGELTQAAFCHNHGLRLSTFGYWRTKYLRNASSSLPGSGRSDRNSSDTFIPIDVSVKQSGFSCDVERIKVEITYSGGTSLKLEGISDLAQIQTLIPEYSL
jgi:hypothetical protein